MRSAMGIRSTLLISSFNAASALALRRRFGKGDFAVAMNDYETVQPPLQALSATPLHTSIFITMGAMRHGRSLLRLELDGTVLLFRQTSFDATFYWDAVGSSTFPGANTTAGANIGGAATVTSTGANWWNAVASSTMLATSAGSANATDAPHTVVFTGTGGAVTVTSSTNSANISDVRRELSPLPPETISVFDDLRDSSRRRDRGDLRLSSTP